RLHGDSHLRLLRGSESRRPAACRRGGAGDLRRGRRARRRGSPGTGHLPRQPLRLRRRPRSRQPRHRGPDRAGMILHAIVADARMACWAAGHGATVVQLRLKDAGTLERVAVGREVLAAVDPSVIVVMNDDVEAAATLRVAVHLGQDDPGVERARQAGIAFGRSAGTVEEAREAEAMGAAYIGAGAVWATPSKT